jgi:hypothetical protein
LAIHARASEAIKAAIDAINFARVFNSQRFNHIAPTDQSTTALRQAEPSGPTLHRAP